MIRPTGLYARVFILAISWMAVVDFAAADDLQLNAGATGMYLRIKALQTPTSVLHVVAHPDDEDGGMLAYCARELGVRTMLFSLTRGEGGANLISSHFFDELGALRTLEHLKAASYYGNELFYSRAADYGYSKTLDEAMRQWQNGVPLLEDLVEVIRRERPTILLSRFAGDSRDGHGHHQMAGVLSRQAIAAAADPNQFPDQIRRGLPPWQIKKFYVRAGSPWRPPKEGEWTVALPIGKYDPVIGRSPAQIARFGLGFQRSQGMSGHIAEAGPKFSYYRLERKTQGESPNIEESLVDGIATSWAGLIPDASDTWGTVKSELEALDVHLIAIFSRWDAGRPELSCRSLLDLRKRLDRILKQKLPDGVRSDLDRLQKLTSDAILHAAGIDMDAWATDSEGQAINHATPGEELTVHVRFANQGRLDASIFLEEVSWPNGRQKFEVERSVLEAGSVAEFTTKFKLPLDTTLTRPHWTRANVARPLYRVEHDGKQRPSPNEPLRAMARVFLDEFPLDFVEPVETRRRDPEFGNVRYPLAIAPDKSVRFALGAAVVQKNQSSFSTSVTVRNTAKQTNHATVRLELPDGWSCKPNAHEITFQREDQEIANEFQIGIPDAAAEKEYRIQAIVSSSVGEFREGFESITARDLGRMNIYHNATQRIQIVDAKVLGEPQVGYISGSGDRVAESLKPLGILPTFLSEADLANSDLSRFDVILVGVRAYAVREDVRTHNSRLLEYVKRGGVLIVQYQTPEFDYNFGPYPYEMGRGPEEVSEELAPVVILEPKHPVFQIPNVITSRDFDGWFEQRGSKFWRTWDKKYTPLLECHDTAQPPQLGGQLIAQYGNGVYVYSAYAWYRQLPQGVPGAYRLFANLLSLPETELVE